MANLFDEVGHSVKFTKKYWSKKLGKLRKKAGLERDDYQGLSTGTQVQLRQLERQQAEERKAFCPITSRGQCKTKPDQKPKSAVFLWPE